MVPTVVTSTRAVRWQSFSPNFFAVFDPRSLEKAPKQFAILVRAPDETAIAHLQRDVVSGYPSVSSLDLSLVQRTVTNVLGKVTMAIRFLALISLALGVPVLFSAVAATRRERLREGVLLKTLGATRRQIGRIMLAEYALLGHARRDDGRAVVDARELGADPLDLPIQLRARVRAGGSRRGRDDRIGGGDRIDYRP